ncbi:MAG TPA: histidine kinase [Solirubrobacteraceae bacterium]|jgi:signal transduction histidine kinase|nr:histidine kinase [Solirubrobacteraceae bacterium]
MIWLAKRIWRYFAHPGVWTASNEPVPPELVFLRMLGVGYLLLIVIATATTRTHPSFEGRGLTILLALITLIVSLFVNNPRAFNRGLRARLVAFAVTTASAAVLAAVQPNGLWEATPYYVAVVAAMRLPSKLAVWTLGLNLAVLGVVAAFSNHWGQAVGTLIGAVPWFLVMRQVRRMREQNVALEASQAAEARAAAAAERGRLAREMHDVLAHTLSALALQLESTRLLAHDRGVDADVSRAIDQAHGLAAGGLEEARRAISAARGDALPGPERVQSLAEAVAEQSGLPVTVDVRGEPRELPADARLAVYRTAQEALTNVRRHATPDRIEVRLDYQPDAVALVVEDHGAAAAAVAVGGGGGSGAGGAVASAGAGYGLTGMRERAELLGGTLVAEPTEDGFRVQLVLPA